MAYLEWNFPYFASLRYPELQWYYFSPDDYSLHCLAKIKAEVSRTKISCVDHDTQTIYVIREDGIYAVENGRIKDPTLGDFTKPLLEHIWNRVARYGTQDYTRYAWREWFTVMRGYYMWDWGLWPVAVWTDGQKSYARDWGIVIDVLAPELSVGQFCEVNPRGVAVCREIVFGDEVLRINRQYKEEATLTHRIYSRAAVEKDVAVEVHHIKRDIKDGQVAREESVLSFLAIYRLPNNYPIWTFPLVDMENLWYRTYIHKGRVFFVFMETLTSGYIHVFSLQNGYEQTMSFCLDDGLVVREGEKDRVKLRHNELCVRCREGNASQFFVPSDETEWLPFLCSEPAFEFARISAPDWFPVRTEIAWKRCDAENIMHRVREEQG